MLSIKTPVQIIIGRKTIAIYQLNAEYSIIYVKSVNDRSDIYQNYLLLVMIIKVLISLFRNFKMTNKKYFYLSFKLNGGIEYRILTTKNSSQQVKQLIHRGLYVRIHRKNIKGC
ncbi:MAG: hypothetical protein D8M26_05895 [Ignavibacteriae bacterium]|nr:hypothetical protein [Ignavibacteriota bacterium]